jgi:hypothetical protein
MRDHAVAGVEQYLHVEHAGENPPAKQPWKSLSNVTIEFVDNAQQ